MPAAVTDSPEGFPPQDLRRFLELCAGEWLALRSHFDLSLATAEPLHQAAAAIADPAAADSTAATAPSGAAAGAAEAAATADPTAVAPERAASLEAGSDAARPDRPDVAALLAEARAGVEEAPIEEAWHSSERGELLVAFLAPDQADQPGALRVTPPAGPSRELHFRADGSFAAAAQAQAEGRWQLWPDGSVELTIETPGRVLRERIWFTQPNLRLRSSVEHRQGGMPGRARFSSEIRRVRKPVA